MESSTKAALLLAVTVLAFAAQAFQVVRCAEIDIISTAVSVYDGDTFTLATGERVRLADIDAPEMGETGSLEARDYLSLLVRQKTVYLDVDDKYRTDRYGRFVCVVYVDHNSTHYLNVNRALLEGGLAEAKNYDNEFDPRSFVAYLPKGIDDQPGGAGSLSASAIMLALAAVTIGLLMAFLRRR